jgi:O-antigen/teichoic acid export membrane protein
MTGRFGLLRRWICLLLNIHARREGTFLAGSIIFFVARLLPSLLAVVTTALLTRLLEPAVYGMYALGLSIIFLITIGAFEWLGLSVMRMATTAKQQELFFGTVVACFCALSGISAVVATGVVLFSQSTEMLAFTSACLFAGLTSAWVELKQRLQMAELNREAYFWTSVGRGVASITLITAAACFYKTAPPLLAATGFSALLATLLYREPRLSWLKYRFDIKVLRSLLRFGLPLSVSVGLATILVSVDKWMLQGLSGPQSVGLFTASTLITQVPIATLASCIGPYSYSMAVEAVEFRSAEAANAQLQRNFVFLLGLVLPGAAGIVALSENLAHVIVGPDYSDTVIRLAPWLAGAAVLSSMRAFYVDTAFQLAHRVSALTWINFIAIGVNLILDFWLIPTAGELGAAMSSFLAILVSLIVASVWSLRVFRLSIPYVGAAKIVASTAFMFLILRSLTGFFGVPALACQLAIGLTVYLAAVIAFNVLGVRRHLLERFPFIKRRLLRAR